MSIKLSTIKSSTTLSGILKGDGTNITTAVSGTDIKTVNSQPLIGSGDINIGGASSGLVWDPTTSANLGTQTEATAVSVSVKAVTPYTSKTISYTVTSGTLPPGLAITQATGILSGTLPNMTDTNTYNFTISASDTLSTITKSFTMIVSATNSAPVWSTGASIGTLTGTSIQLSATDAEGTSLTYSLVGSVSPAISGFNVSSSGTVSFTTNPMNNSTYSFTVSVSDGVNSVNRTFSFTAPLPSGSAVYTTPGTYSWTCPAGVTSVSVVCVGAGSYHYYTGGKGGALRYKNSISVTPGNSYPIVVGKFDVNNQTNVTATYIGGDSSAFSILAAGGDSTTSSTALSTGVVGGGNGGITTNNGGAGGAGAGGYSGDGGGGGYGYASSSYSQNYGYSPAGSGSGGAGGGGQGSRNSSGDTLVGAGGGGGVGLYGIGNSGAGADNYSGGLYGGAAGAPGGGGSNGGSGGYGFNDTSTGSTAAHNGKGGAGGAYGGGAGGSVFGGGSYPVTPSGGSGAVRIMWGPNKSFPSNAS